MKPLRDTFTIELVGGSFKVDIAELVTGLKIDPNDPSDDLRTQSAQFAWVAVLCSQAEYRVSIVKQELAVAKAAIAREIRSEADLQQAKKPTEAAIDEAVTVDPIITDLTDAFLNASREANILGAMREAYRQRRDMLGALAYSTRQRERAEE